MALAGTTAVTEFWAKCKAWFGRKLGTSKTATTVSIQLKNNAGDNLGDAATIAAADGTNAGVMTADMYTKLNGIEAQANKTTVDSELSSTSTNPVQNKAVNTALAGKAASSHSHDAATTSAAGFMSATDKEKLNGIATGANAYEHPTSGPSSSSSTSKGDTANQTPSFGATFKVTSETVDKYGHTTALGEHTVKIPNATATASTGGEGGSAGLMSATDKEKLNGVESGANNYTHPTTTAATAAAKKVGNDSSGHVVLGDAITASDVGAASSSHAHGNITNGGDITATAPTIASGDKLIINDESASKITNGPAFGSSTSTFLRNDGTWAAPISPYSSNPEMDGTASSGSSNDYARGDHVHPTDTSRLSGVTLNTSSEPYDVPVSNSIATITIGDGLSVSDSGNTATLSAKTGTTSGTVAAGNHTHSGYADSSHVHGNITNSGDITATAPTVASGDKLIINDESASKITNGPSFGTSTSTYLRNDGTWGTPDGTYSHPSHTAHSTSQIYKFTNDNKGHVDSATAASASDVVTLLGTTAVNRATADSNGNTFGAAAAKAVDTSISAGSSSTNLPTTKAVSDFVASQVTGATAFQGTVSSNTTIENSSYVSGWYWVVATAGTYVGQTCEVGDMIFAVENKGASYSASDFSVVQNNIVEMTAAEVDAICV